MNKIYLLCIVFVFASCRNTYYTPKQIDMSVDVPTYQLEFTKLPIECPGAFGVVGLESKAIVFTRDNRSFLQVFDYEGNIIAKLSPKGRAANEFQSVSINGQKFKIDNDYYFYVYDYPDYYLYNISGSIRAGANLTPKKVAEKSDHFMSKYLFREDGSYFSLRTVSEFGDPRDGFMFSPPEFTLHQTDGKLKKYNVYPDIVDYLNVGPDMLYDSFIHMTNDLSTVYDFASYQDRITIFDLETGKTKGVRGPDFVDFSTLYGMDMITIAKKLVNGYMDTEQIDNYLFVLYDQRTAYDDMEDIPLNVCIRVLDLDCNLKAVIELGEPITSISYDRESKKLLANDGQENIYIADITSIMSLLQ